MLTYTSNIFSQNSQIKMNEGFDINTVILFGTLCEFPRRARREFEGMLNESLFLYLEFDMNKYLRN